MPFAMPGYVQSVVVQGRVYVGGGYAGNARLDNYMIMEYDISSGHWTKLPPYRFRNFAMTVIHNELVLVGGQGQVQGQYSKMLGVWRAESQEWTLNFPEMLTARSSCSAVVYNEWLVVAGGEEGQMSSVDVMNTGTKQWFAGSPTPSRWRGMKTASIGDTLFLHGWQLHWGKNSICNSRGVQRVPPSSHISDLLVGFHGSKQTAAYSDMEGDTTTTYCTLQSSLDRWVFACSRWAA